MNTEAGGSELLGLARALDEEALAQRRNLDRAGGVPLVDGRLVARTDEGAIFDFELVGRCQIPEGSPAQLRVGEGTNTCELLQRGDEEISLFVVPEEDGQLPPSSVNSATLQSDASFLSVELGKRMRDINSSPAPTTVPLQRLLARLAGAPHAGGTGPWNVPDEIDLNAQQNESVGACLAEDLWFVWGPPGTGKTLTLGSYAAELAVQGETLIVAAHSTVAVDAAMAAAMGELEVRAPTCLTVDHILRVGHSLHPEIRDQNLSSYGAVLKRYPDLRRRRDDLTRGLARSRSQEELDELRSELADVRRQIRDREGELIDEAPVVFCTLSKLAVDPRLHEGTPAGATVVDEASMASVPQVLLAASRAERRLSVFGDFRQLPAIVTSEDDAIQRALGRDVFVATDIAASVDRGDDPGGVTMLREQYRMAPAIREVVSDLSYLGRLSDGRRVPSVTAPFAETPPAPGQPIAVVNARLLGSGGWYDHAHSSRFNPVSAMWAFRLALEALNGSRAVDQVALLAPYRAQVHLLTALTRGFGLREHLTVGTVHRMQGSEAPAVVFDLVDAPPVKQPGRVLQEPTGRRLVNVALSRAKGKLIVVGDIGLLRPADGFKRSGAALGSMLDEHEWREDGADWSYAVASDSIEYILDESSARERYRQDVHGQLALCWVGSESPPWLAAPVAVDAKLPAKQTGQSLVISGNVAWIIARRPDRSYALWRVESRRFVEALFEQLDASGRRPLAPCARHADVGHVDSSGRFPVVRCSHPGCAQSRSPTQADLDGWARLVGQMCPSCGNTMVARRGDRGWFYACPRTCGRTAPLSG